MDINLKTHKNGLRSLRVLSKDTQVATVMYLVKVGSRHELPEEAGLSHFVEHTIFKGTEKRPDTKQIGTEIESLGGTSNAFTAQDYTGYYIKSPAQNFEHTFEILSDMFLNSQFKEEHVKKEKGVIVEEIKMYEDRPISKVSQEWQKNFFLDHNLGKDIAGTIESVNAMHRQQFFDYMQKHYYAENVLLVIAGNVDESKVDEMVDKYCMQIPSVNKGNESQSNEFIFKPDETRQRKVRLPKDVQQTHLLLGGLGLNRDHEDRFAMQVTNSILGNGFGSRLFQVIRDELGLAYYVYARSLTYDEVGVFQIALGVDPSREEEAIDAVKKQLEILKEGELSAEEIDRAKNYLLGNLTTELETSDDIASFYGMQELLNKKRFTIDEMRSEIMKIQKDDIVRVSSKLFHEENYYLAAVAKQY